MRLVLISLAAVALVAVASASADSLPQSPRALRADVAEWSIVPSEGVVAAGTVRITVRNVGDDAHSLVLVRTRGFDDRLRLRGAHAVVQPIARSPLIAAGAAASFSAVLRRGNYLLLDNGPWAYWRGASAAFTVR